MFEVLGFEGLLIDEDYYIVLVEKDLFIKWFVFCY